MRFIPLVLSVFLLTSCTDKEPTQTKQAPEVERMIAQAKSTWQVGQCLLRTFLKKGVVTRSETTQEWVFSTNAYEKTKKFGNDIDAQECPKGTQIIAPISYLVRAGITEKEEHLTLVACYGDCQYASPPSVE